MSLVLLPDHLHAVAIAADDLKRPVGRAVVDDDYFKSAIGLSEH
jgi:hypothetical protein